MYARGLAMRNMEVIIISRIISAMEDFRRPPWFLNRYNVWGFFT
jgi:hypothetical protein